MSAGDAKRQLGDAVGEANITASENGQIFEVRPRAAGELGAALGVARELGLDVRVGESDGAGLQINLARMTQVLHVDETSLLVHAQAGLTIAALEAELGHHALSLGPAARRSSERTLGALLAAPRADEASPRGRMIDACAAVDGVLADGTIINTRLAPRRATGPDLRHALLGERGRTGVITAAWLRCLRRSPERAFAAFAFSSGEAAITTAKTLLFRGARPADLSIVDGALAKSVIETVAASAEEALLMIAFDGVVEVVTAELAIASSLAAERAARTLAPSLAQAWLRAEVAGRNQGFVPWTALAAAWTSRGDRAELCAFAPAGAALLSDRAVPKPLDPTFAIRDAIARALDPAALFSRREPS